MTAMKYETREEAEAYIGSDPDLHAVEIFEEDGGTNYIIATPRADDEPSEFKALQDDYRYDWATC
jgi:hypothetical protein